MNGATNVIGFRPRVPVVTIEFVRVGWNVVAIEIDGSRVLLDNTAGTLEPALDCARFIARETGARFVPGDATPWCERRART